MKVLETIGSTPLVQLTGIGEGRIYAKLEKVNPAGSIKDRPAYYMIRSAIEQGQLKKGMKLVEPTSGNTGIALALIGRRLGFEVVLVMPASMSVERRALMQAYGAKLILVEAGGMQGAVDRAEALVAQGGYYMPNQFANPANALAHEETTGPEILQALDGIGAFVAGIGTGGTVSGVGRAFQKAHCPAKIIGLEPAESPLITQGRAGGHLIQGIGANFVPQNFDPSVVNEVITVPGEEAIRMARRLAAEEGLSVGISAGANVAGALSLLERVSGAIVTVLPDSNERYLSTTLFQKEA